MTEKQISIFMSVANTGSFSKAASALNITEPAVSRSIKTLEQEFGCDFFIRDKGRRCVSLTEKGVIFVDMAKRWLYLKDDALKLASNEQATLRVLATATLTTLFVPKMCDRLHESHPSLQLSVDSHHTRTSTDLVAQNMCDLALGSFILPDQRVKTIPLFQEELRFVCARADNKADKYIDISKLNNNKQLFISWDTDNYVWEHFIQKNNNSFVINSNTVDGIEYYIGKMGMWALAPVTFAGYLCKMHGFYEKRIVNDVPKRITYAMYNIGNANTIVNEAISLIREDALSYDGVEPL